MVIRCKTQQPDVDYGPVVGSKITMRRMGQPLTRSKRCIGAVLCIRIFICACVSRERRADTATTETSGIFDLGIARPFSVIDYQFPVMHQQRTFDIFWRSWVSCCSSVREFQKAYYSIHY